MNSFLGNYSGNYFGIYFGGQGVAPPVSGVLIGSWFSEFRSRVWMSDDRTRIWMTQR